MKKQPKIATFYTDIMVCGEHILESSASFSPLKPKLLLERVEEVGLLDNFEIISNFKPYTKDDFLIAHDELYVNNFFNGIGNFRSNGLPWSEELVESVKYTNASLYEAIKFAVENPDRLVLSPTSGFHHAKPWSGEGFCTFSGQVIASIKIWREKGLRGAYIDLDAHHGNSIDDSRNYKDYLDDLNEAIPIGFNMNYDFGYKFWNSYTKDLEKLISAIDSGYIDYVVFCHGADSHIKDDFGGYLSTEDWIKCAEVFSKTISDYQLEKNKQVPVIMSLFGGYRKKAYQEVLDLHISSIMTVNKNLT